MKKINTIIVPIIRPDFIGRMLETLWKHTPENFYVFVIDQTEDDQAYLENHKKTHFWIKSYRNLGFSKGMNTGIKLAQTKYVTLANDDLEFINQNWWQGIVDTFATDPRIVAVNPMSPKEATWGYGLTVENKDTWQPPKGFIPSDDTKQGMIPLIQDKPFTYKESYTQEEYDSLLNNHPTWSKDTMCDAIAMWCTVFRRQDLINPERIGLLDERFYPGGGEDYEMNGRAYSCAWPYDREECDPDYHWRMVGTSKSWVWHHWGKSRDISAKKPEASIFSSRSRWNDLSAIWQPSSDPWGHHEKDSVRKPNHRIGKIIEDDL